MKGKTKKNTLAILVIAIIGIIFSCGTKQIVFLDFYDMPVITEESDLGETRAEQVIRALARAYPDRISTVEYRNGDWAFLLRDRWFYFAEGRILPEEQRENYANFRPFGFYYYPAELPEWRERTAEEVGRARNITTTRAMRPPRANYFLDELWQAETRAQIENQLVRINFLGRSTRIHPLIQDQLARVEEHILAAAAADPEVQTWINELNIVEAFVWRNIVGTQLRSYHSYGIAIDLLPSRELLASRRLQTFWAWTADHREDWWNVPFTQRYHPPQAAIEAFEANGFIWGGKWLLFDTMHFEYRPEILILNQNPIFLRYN